MGTLRDDILSIFGDNGAPPVGINAFNENWEYRQFTAKLQGKRWQELLEPSVRKAISNDAVDWVGFMTDNWLAYYLPALMLMALADNEAFASNLRGHLAIVLEPNEHSRESTKQTNSFLHAALSEEQWNIVERYNRASERSE